jgi:hypothetical protein
VYSFSQGHAQAHQNYLNAAYNNGYLPIYSMFSVWVPIHTMSAAVPLNAPDFIKYTQQYYDMAKEVACHPGTMGFVIGGEMNFEPVMLHRINIPETTLIG